MPKPAVCKLRQLLLNFSAVRILKLCTHAHKLSLQENLLDSYYCQAAPSLAPGSQQASLPIIPPVPGQDLITAEYIPIWGYCRPVRVLIVNDGAALSDSFLPGKLAITWLAILKAVSSLA